MTEQTNDVSPKVRQTIEQLSPLVASMANRAVEALNEGEMDNIDELDISTPHEIFGLIVDRAHQFIQAATDEDTSCDCFEAIRDIQLETTVWLYQMRKAMLQDQGVADEPT
jgi:hypothetical protein